jgi:hypothetical protein
MKTRYLIVILWTMLLFPVVHAQTGSFPTLPPVPRTGQLADDPTKTHFTFIAAGDNRPSGGKVKQPPTLAYILKHSRKHNPTFILWSGDTIGGFRTKTIDRSHLIKQYHEFFRVASSAKVPIFNSPGNHEMDRVDKLDNGEEKETVETPDASMEQLYLQQMLYPANAPPFGAFNYGNSRFIAVDTEEIPPLTALRSPGKVVANNLKLDPGFVSVKQIELLTADLEANQDKTHIFVFMHHPINPAKSGSRLNQTNADELQALFAKYKNVTYVIAAHEHLYFNATGKTLQPKKRTSPSLDGPGYLVSGGAGAPLDKCPSKSSKNCLAAYHYLVFHVKGSEIDVKLEVVQTLTKPPKKSPQ